MKVGDYVRIKWGNGLQTISKCTNIVDMGDTQYTKNDFYIHTDKSGEVIYKSMIVKSSPNIIDLIEYMDLLVLEHPIKLYDSDTTIGLFNPVRCDGFTTFEDGTHCIILNMDYIVDVKDLKIKSVVTHEQFSQMEYKVGE